MTVVVIGIIAVPLALLINQQIKSVFVSQDLTVARNLARFEMEKINNIPYADIVSADFSNYQGYGYNVVRAVSYVEGNDTSPESLKKITVSVVKSDNAQILAVLITYLAKNVSYGL